LKRAIKANLINYFLMKIKSELLTSAFIYPIFALFGP